MNLLVGDSHSLWITFKDSIHLLCSAGSAKGLNNPNSISQYNKTIIENIANNSYKHLFFLFGGVDTDFVFIHKYLENPQINYVDFNLDVIKNYLNFIITNFYDKSVIILSVGLPCLDDENLKKGLLNGHVNHLENKDLIDLENNLSKANLPNIYDRTKITLHFNKELEKAILLLNNPNIKYLDITSFTYCTESHRIKDEFFTRNDHHNYTRNKYISNLIGYVL